LELLLELEPCELELPREPESLRGALPRDPVLPVLPLLPRVV